MDLTDPNGDIDEMDDQVLDELFDVGGVDHKTGIVWDGVHLDSSQSTHNSFCPTGEGGGVDSSCGKPLGKSRSKKVKGSWRDQMVASTPWQPGEGSSASNTTSRAAVASHISELASRSQYGIVQLTDLHDSLGKPPVERMHEHVRSLWREGAISVEEHEGRSGITQRQLETALMVPSSRTGGLDSRITSIYVTDRSKLSSYSKDS